MGLVLYACPQRDLALTFLLTKFSLDRFFGTGYFLVSFLQSYRTSRQHPGVLLAANRDLICILLLRAMDVNLCGWSLSSTAFRYSSGYLFRRRFHRTVT